MVAPLARRHASDARPGREPSRRGYSLWLDQLAASGRDDLARRAPLAGDTTADVCIVGAGYTGLWTAYYLKRADPSLRITVLEARFAGFGASGRNGGWLSGLAPGHRTLLAADLAAVAATL